MLTMMVCVSLSATALLAANTTPAFVLKEQLGRAWSNECVTFDLDAGQLASAKAGKALVERGGEEAAYQVVATGATSRVCFQADLEPGRTLTYRFSTKAAKRPSTDLNVIESARTIQLVNSRIGIELRRKLGPDGAPLARIRLGSGAWTGGATLSGGSAVTDYATEIVARGPVFVEAVCRVTFADGGAGTCASWSSGASPW